MMGLALRQIEKVDASNDSTKMIGESMDWITRKMPLLFG